MLPHQNKINLFRILLLLIVCSCRWPQHGNKQTVAATVNTDSLLAALNTEVLSLIKHKDYNALSRYAHPVEGIRFSPYAFVDTGGDIKLSAKTLAAQAKKTDSLSWGNYDGSGDNIRLSFQDYFNRFVYNADFLNAEQVSINKMIGGGNSLNNLTAAYPGADFTENYFSGFDPKYGGMDWCCLRLVFKKQGNKYYIIAIIHDQWTI